MTSDQLTDRDYERLLAFRTELRGFLHWSEEQAVALGITAAQHQLLLAIRGHDDPRGPTVGDVATALMLRHHSAVGLVDRAAEAGLVRREPDPVDLRYVRLRLTPAGRRVLAQLSRRHLEELGRLGNGLYLAPGLRSGRGRRGPG
jgi:DNA-binding MarR family transcriptional regulator